MSDIIKKSQIESTQQPLITLDTMTATQFNIMMAQGLEQAKAGKGMSLEEAFDRLNKMIE